uniref:Uncharacterized protein n=1 Tax=Anguilla anguilla TaxID=7936 RepID=A0A0E9PDD3_ANGAN
MRMSHCIPATASNQSGTQSACKSYSASALL